MILRSFKYKLYPKKSQRKTLDSHLNLLCWLYNQSIEAVKKTYLKDKTYLGRSGLYALIASWILIKPELKEIHSQVRQNVCDRIDKAFKAFFRRVKAGEKPGYPRFKSWRRYSSLTFPQSGFALKDGFLTLSKIGKIKTKVHRQLSEMVKTCTIKKDSTGDYWVTLVVEVPEKPLPANDKVLGIDVGLTNMVAFDDGTIIKAPKFYRTLEKRLAKAQRKLSSLEKNTKPYHKQRQIVAKIHRRITNLRHNFTHQLSSYLIKNYQYIFYEDLNLKKLIAKNYAKSWHDVAVGQLFSQIMYKVESAGRYQQAIDPAYTSQMCSSCGQLVPKDLSQRRHQCPYCGYDEDRDVNAAKNVKRLGIESLEATFLEAS